MVRTLFGMLAIATLVIGSAACEENERPPQIPLASMPQSGCSNYVGQQIERLCLPRVARESTPLALDIEAACGSCGTQVDRCSVAIDAHDVTLSLDGKTCVASTTCSEPCGKRRVTCTIPRLEPGRYRVHWGDSSGRIDTLEVTAGGGDARCSFENGPRG